MAAEEEADLAELVTLRDSVVADLEKEFAEFVTEKALYTDSAAALESQFASLTPDKARTVHLFRRWKITQRLDAALERRGDAAAERMNNGRLDLVAPELVSSREFDSKVLAVMPVHDVARANFERRMQAQTEAKAAGAEEEYESETDYEAEAAAAGVSSSPVSVKSIDHLRPVNWGPPPGLRAAPQSEGLPYDDYGVSSLPIKPATKDSAKRNGEVLENSTVKQTKVVEEDNDDDYDPTEVLVTRPPSRSIVTAPAAASATPIKLEDDDEDDYVPTLEVPRSRPETTNSVATSDPTHTFPGPALHRETYVSDSDDSSESSKASSARASNQESSNSSRSGNSASASSHHSQDDSSSNSNSSDSDSGEESDYEPAITSVNSSAPHPPFPTQTPVSPQVSSLPANTPRGPSPSSYARPPPRRPANYNHTHPAPQHQQRGYKNRPPPPVAPASHLNPYQPSPPPPSAAAAMAYYGGAVPVASAPLPNPSAPGPGQVPYTAGMYNLPYYPADPAAFPPYYPAAPGPSQQQQAPPPQQQQGGRRRQPPRGPAAARYGQRAPPPQQAQAHHRRRNPEEVYGQPEYGDESDVSGYY